MSHLALMTDYNLRMEVEALRQDLNAHYLDFCFGGDFPQQQEMYLWKKVRLAALEAFANAQRVISQRDPRAVFSNYTRQRYGPSPCNSRHNPYRRRPQKTSKVPMKKMKDCNKENAIMSIKKEPKDDARETQGSSRPLALMPVKLEDIKKEKE